MNLLTWIMFGTIIGIFANIINYRTTPERIVNTTILGLAGALFGGIISTIMFHVDLTSFSWQSFTVAVFGSFIVLCIGRIITKQQY